MKALTIIAVSMFTMSSLFAQNGEKARDVRQDNKEIRKDRKDLREDRRERNIAAKTGHPRIAAAKERDVRMDKKDLRQDKREKRRDLRK